MKQYIIFTIIIFLFAHLCISQEKIINLENTRLIDRRYEIIDKTYFNEIYLFLNFTDTLKINSKKVYNYEDVLKSNKIEFYSNGLFYNCQLKKDSIYSFKIKKVCKEKIISTYNNFYLTNAIFNDTNNCSKFKEIKNENVYYENQLNVSRYIDINNELYEIIGLTPSNDCFFGH